jgi:hypothetical protein
MMGPFRKGDAMRTQGLGSASSAQVAQGEEQATTTHARALHDKEATGQVADASTAVMAAELHNRLLNV